MPSHGTQLVVAGVVSGVLVAGAILGYQSLSRSGEESKERKAKAKAKAVPTRSELYADAAARLAADDARREDALAAVLSGRAQAGEFDASLIAEALARTAAFLDAPGSGGGLAAVRASFVVVVGLGGVGSHCVSALARSGVGRIRVIDFDQVSLSSLNRHALATLADVGTSKVGCVARRLAAAVPWIRVQQRGVKFDLSVADALLGPWGEPRFPGGKDMRVPRRREEEDVEATWEWETKMPDFVVDAIDNIDTKVDLLAYCATHGIPVVSAMGAGCKSDPTRLLVADVSRGTDDPLARSTRRRLRLRGVDPALVHMVYSAEPVTGREAEGKARLLPLPDEEFDKGQVGELAVLPNFRARILPVIGTLPAVFGYAVANHVILEISGYPHRYYLPSKPGPRAHDAALAALQASEEKLARQEEGAGPDAGVGLRLPITPHDAAFLVDDVFRGRSVVSGLASRLVLVRWRRPEPGAGSIVARVDSGGVDGAVDGPGAGAGGGGVQKSSNVRFRDLVCMTKEEAAVHEREVLRGNKQPEELYGADVVERVTARMAEAREWEQYRM